jgi:Rieske Fe-S protein
VQRKTSISRKEFLKKLWWIVLLPYLMMMALMNRRHKTVTAINEVRIANRIPDGISFYGDVICIKEKSDLKFYYSKCTHLGCRINKTENGKLICPCHGSEFGLDGTAMKGPANKSLQELESSFDEENSEYVIRFV